MKFKYPYYCLLALFLIGNLSFSQQETSKWKALFAVGINSPSQEGLIEPFMAESINFPAINLGLQHMFKPQFGVKVDFGYNQFSNIESSPDFKVNYSRINAQVVFDTTRYFNFLSIGMGFVFHTGPGLTMIKPLDIYRENKTSYFNAMAGVELHYSISSTVSLFLDGSYIMGFSDDFDPISTGAGSFNGNMITITFGASVSLSGCRTCN